MIKFSIDGGKPKLPQHFYAFEMSDCMLLEKFVSAKENPLTRFVVVIYTLEAWAQVARFGRL